MTVTDLANREKVAPVTATAHRLLSAPVDHTWHAHERHFGPLVHPVDLIAEVSRAGLRGRGGAGFPTAVKLDAVRRAASGRRRRPVVVANGAEGEPASAKDRVLLRVNPHLVFDGMVAAGRAVGAARAILCVKADGELVESLERANADRPKEPVSIEIVTVPHRYVAGEESALMNWLNHGRALPQLTPPRPAERGVKKSPTLVDNVETLANLALIARFGSPWWRQLGTADAPGSILVTVTGAVERPGVLEVPLGARLSEVLARAAAKDPAGVLLGGYFGSWLSPRQAAQAVLTPSDLAARGAGLGCGVIAVLPEDPCPLVEVAGVSRWLAGQSAGQCGPCINGLPAMAAGLDELVAGTSPDAQANLAHWGDLVRGRGACKMPDGAVTFVRSALEVFADHVERHRRHGPCSRGSRSRYLPTPAWEA